MPTREGRGLGGEEARALARRIHEFEPFGMLEQKTLAEMAASFERLTLGVGEALESGGQERLFLVLSGLIAVLDRPLTGGERWVTELRPGDLFIERAPGVAGEMQTDLRSLAETELVALSIDAVQRITDTRGAELEPLIDEIAEKLHRIQVVVHLGRLFHVLEPGAVRELLDETEWVTLESGAALFEHGDPADAAFIVINGRLRVVLEEPDGDRVLNEVGRGETIGEMALLSAAPRSATVYAVRDSQLARLPAEPFATFLQNHPGALQPLLELALARLRSHNGVSRQRGNRLTTVTVVPLDPVAAASGFAAGLGEALAAFGDTVLVDRRRVESALGPATLVHAAGRSLISTRLVEWLNEREAYHRFVVFEADAEWSGWTERALRQADHVLFVAAAEASPELRPVEKRFAAAEGSPRSPRQSLILLHAAGARPQGTGAWLERRAVRHHFHAALGEAADHARIARMLTGRAIGLVLGGGGARGFAHIGVLRAFEEIGIPVDILGGTSLGAIISGLSALGMSAREILDHCREHFVSLFDPTLPIVALLAGRRIGGTLHRSLGEQRIEDLWRPYFCISTNLTDAAEEIHRRGVLKTALRCSISIPGVLPPVRLGDKIHVDGGLLNNLPIDVLFDLADGGQVAAVNVSPEVDLKAAGDLYTEVSGWRALWNRLNPFVPTLPVPSIASLIIRGTVVGSIRTARRLRSSDLAGLYLRPPIDDCKLLDFHRVEEIAERGYHAALEPARRWWREISSAASG